MQRRDDAIASCEQIEPRPLGRQPLTGVQEQQRPTLTTLDQFEADAGETDSADHLAASSMRTRLI
jgi:hypothetical protein